MCKASHTHHTTGPLVARMLAAACVLETSYAWDPCSGKLSLIGGSNTATKLMTDFLLLKQQQVVQAGEHGQIWLFNLPALTQTFFPPLLFSFHAYILPIDQNNLHFHYGTVYLVITNPYVVFWEQIVYAVLYTKINKKYIYFFLC